MHSLLILLPQNICAIIVASLCFTLGGCAPWYPIVDTAPLEKREEGTVLIIGCVIIAPAFAGYHKYGPMRVVLGYQKPCEERERLEQIWAEPDSMGYFALVNMPAGRYTICGVRLDGQRSVFFYPFSGDSIWVEQYEEIFPFSCKSETWPELEEGGIYNFGYLVLAPVFPPKDRWDDRVRAIHCETLIDPPPFVGLEPYQLYKHYRSPVPQYFIEYYPDSEWTRYLRRLLEHKQE